LIESGDVRLVDVRTPEEFEVGHLNGATNVNIGASDFRKRLTGLDPSTPTLVYCRSGNRSTQALKVFEAVGFEDITHLDGGMNAWQRYQDGEGGQVR
jgi:rhodanese-related sulfurtransferase